MREENRKKSEKRERRAQFLFITTTAVDLCVYFRVNMWEKQSKHTHTHHIHTHKERERKRERKNHTFFTHSNNGTYCGRLLTAVSHNSSLAASPSCSFLSFASMQLILPSSLSLCVCCVTYQRAHSSEAAICMCVWEKHNRQDTQRREEQRKWLWCGCDVCVVCVCVCVCGLPYPLQQLIDSSLSFLLWLSRQNYFWQETKFFDRMFSRQIFSYWHQQAQNLEWEEEKLRKRRQRKGRERSNTTKKELGLYVPSLSLFLLFSSLFFPRVCCVVYFRVNRYSIHLYFFSTVAFPKNSCLLYTHTLLLPFWFWFGFRIVVVLWRKAREGVFFFLKKNENRKNKEEEIREHTSTGLFGLRRNRV